MGKLTAARKRQALGSLSVDRLRNLADVLQVAVSDRRSRVALTFALADGRRVDFAALLSALKLQELKAMCQELGLDDSGRAKAPLIERLLEDSTKHGKRKRGAQTSTRPPRSRKPGSNARFGRTQPSAGDAQPPHGEPSADASAAKDYLHQLDTILTGAIDGIRGLQGLESRLDQMQGILTEAHEGELAVGIIGITSSGKSTFLNALMGEELLPEQSRATSNVLTRCRAGTERAVEIRYNNGQREVLRGVDVTPQRIFRLASEEGNARNRKGVALIEWTSPSACIPPGLLLWDTPGLDAYGHKDHEELTLRRFLPLADIVIYITSIRNPFKAADLKLVESLVENDQRVLFVLSQKDLEVDSTEAGEPVKTKEAKLRRHLSRLQSDVARHTELQSYGAVLVSSKLAKQVRGDQKHPVWRESGFHVVVQQLNTLSEQLSEVLVDSRCRRALALLNRSLSDIRTVSGQVAAAPGKPTALASRVASLQQSQKRARALLDNTWSGWAARLDPEPSLRSLTRRSITQCAAARKAHWEVTTTWSDLPQKLVQALDQAQRGLEAELEQAELKPNRRDATRRSPDRASEPDFDRYVSKTTRSERVREWFESIAFWPKSEDKDVEIVDEGQLRQGLGEYVRESSRMLLSHLDWWKDYANAVYVAALDKALEHEEAALGDQQRLFEAAQSQQAALLSAEQVLSSCAQELQLVRQNVQSSSGDGLGVTGPRSVRRPEPTEGGPSPLRRIVALAWENQIQRDFFQYALSMPQGRAPRVLLLGPRWEPAKTLLAALAHQLGLLQELEDVANDAWLAVNWRSGELPPGTVHQTFPTLPRNAEVLLAPADAQLSATDWPSLFQRADAVCISIDAVRIASGLADLQRAPYAPEASKIKPRVVLHSADGAMFTDKLHHLVRDVLPAAEGAGWAGCRWFIHEDYDSRFTAFVSLCTEVAQRSGGGRELVRRWRQEDISLAPPFTPDAITTAFAAAFQPETR